MSLKEELDLLPEHARDALLHHGKTAIYQAGEWLPDAAGGFTGIRIIEDGEVSVFAMQHDEKTELCRSGKDDVLGVRSMFSPDSLPAIAWRAESDVTCMEFEGRDILPVLQNADGFELRQMLEKAARERDYDVLMTLHPLFRCLPHQERKNLHAGAHPIAMLPDEVLLRQNVENDTLYLISHGRVKVSRNDELLAHREAGDVIGEISVLEKGRAATADVVACGWCEVLAFPGTVIRDYSQAYPAFGNKLAQLCN